MEKSSREVCRTSSVDELVRKVGSPISYARRLSLPRVLAMIGQFSTNCFDTLEPLHPEGTQADVCGWINPFIAGARDAAMR
jgi:hypothetical protein